MRKLRLSAIALGLLAAVLVVAGCGSSGTGSSAAKPSTANGMTVAQILAKSRQAMDKVSSMSFTGDATFKISSNGTSAAGLMLGQQPIAVHLSGKAGGVAGATGTSAAAKAAAGKTMRADVTVTVKTGSQTVGLGFKARGGHSWVNFQGAWYAVPPSKSGSTGSSTGAVKGASGLGIDPAAWAASSTVTTEQLNGASVYHVVVKADTAKITGDLLKGLSSSAFSKAAGSAGNAGAELNLLQHNPALLNGLKKALASASVEEWIDASTFRVVKGAFDAQLHFGSGQSTTGLGVHATLTLGGYNQPVTVVPPLHAKPLKQLTNGLSGLSVGSGVGL
jgi:hypothetical protein